MSFLPKEFRAAEEWTGGLFPTDDGAPLVEGNREVSIRGDDLFVEVAEEDLGGWTDDERVFELLGSSDRGDEGLWGEAFDMLFLFVEHAHRDDEREIDVLGAKLVLDASIEIVLNLFPNGV